VSRRLAQVQIAGRAVALLASASVVAAILAGCGNSDGARPASTATAPSGAAKGAGTVQVRILRDRLVPANVSVKVGQIVVWTNQDSASHRIRTRSGATFTSPRLRAHGTYTYRVGSPGLIRYSADKQHRITGSIHVQR
jgi:plastocyanin